MGEPREKPPAGGGGGGGGGVGRVSVGLSLLFSLLSVGACLLLSAKTSRLQGRLLALEEEVVAGRRDPGAESPLQGQPWLAALQPQVDELLREKLNEGLAKLRTARETPSECRCPPGPPGRRGKPGRRGEPARSYADGSSAAGRVSYARQTFAKNLTKCAQQLLRSSSTVGGEVDDGRGSLRDMNNGTIDNIVGIAQSEVC
ncbi:collagen alpha-1(XXIII) chain-like [Anolis sagrei]|uniref:collagen alpha-1(XXIII) chain-like n=1 Tax=Anolis sagrei TaxID=38937 RepID=UPI0035229EA0